MADIQLADFEQFLDVLRQLHAANVAYIFTRSQYTTAMALYLTEVDFRKAQEVRPDLFGKAFKSKAGHTFYFWVSGAADKNVPTQTENITTARRRGRKAGATR